MDFPITIKVNNLTYKVILVEDKDDKNFYDKETDNLKMFGETNFVNQTIRIWKHLTDERKRITIMHEITHVFYDSYLTSQHIKDQFDEEDICCFVASYSEEIIKLTDYVIFNLHNIGYIIEE